MRDLRKEMPKLYKFIRSNLGKVVAVNEIRSKMGSGLKTDHIGSMIRMNRRYAVFKRQTSGTLSPQYIFIDNRKTQTKKLSEEK